jgi:hypothetical protein
MLPQRDPGVYLEDIEHYAAAAVRFTSRFSLLSCRNPADLHVLNGFATRPSFEFDA